MKGPLEFNTELEQGCAQLGIALSAAQRERMCAHLELLVKWGRRINLSAVARDDMVARHLLDSLSILRFVRGRRLLDVGSGGGFPGIPLAIARPQLQVTLLDSRRKRAAFLRHACAAVRNVEVAEMRVEDAHECEKFDTLAVRAFAPLAGIVAATAALHHRGCRLLAMKGRRPAREIAEIAPALRARCTVETLNVPFLHAERHLIIIEL
ncbi:MAG: 16S rRNA (guanine(527)-N(7))-methyltransferase RsmG [Gammaproteobacteria bacterium]